MKNASNLKKFYEICEVPRREKIVHKCDLQYIIQKSESLLSINFFMTLRMKFFSPRYSMLKQKRSVLSIKKQIEGEDSLFCCKSHFCVPLTSRHRSL